MKIKCAKIKIKQILKNLNNNDTNFEIDLIFSHVLNTTKAKLILANELEISNENFNKILKIAKKRAKGQPLQHLISSWQFYNVELKLNKKVFIPRPETEMLVDFALQLKQKRPHILDLCTGSGCVSAAIAKNNPFAKIKAIDFSKHAYKIAKANTKKFKNQVQVLKNNVLNKNLAKNFKNWADLIVCNPPYLNKIDMENLQKEVKFEPPLALYGGNDGLFFYKKICKLWKQTLKPGGWLAFEIGYMQKTQVEKILAENNFVEIKTFTDYYNNDRMTVSKKL